MTTPEADTTAIIAILRRLLLRAEGQLKQPNPPRGALVMFTLPVRAQLTKIYGTNSLALTHFPLVDSNLPDQSVREELSRRVDQVRRLLAKLESMAQDSMTPMAGRRIFIGHGRSLLWREFKDFISERLKLPWDEFNREAVAGYTTSQRLQTMLSRAGFAFLIMTAEEEHADGAVHARPNVIHEVGLFQGALGLHRAIVMIEDGCSEFSNIVGLSQIRFPRDDISAKFEEVRRVLEREGLIEH